MELSKNNRFRTGSVVDIYHTPVYEGNTMSIKDISVGDDYKVKAYFENDLQYEQFGVNDLCAFSFGVGEITAKTNTVGKIASNYILHSDNLEATSWTKNNVSILLNNDLGLPFTDAKPLSSKIQCDATTSVHNVVQRVVKDAVAKEMTLSLWFISTEIEQIQMKVSDSTGSRDVYFDWEQNTFDLDNTTGTFVTGVKAATVEAGGWKRVSMTFTTGVDAYIDVQLGAIKLFNQDSFLGDGSGGIYITDIQLNDGLLTDFKRTTSEAYIGQTYNTEIDVVFPKSMFPSTEIMTYVGSDVQHVLFFLKTGRVLANFAVAQYKEVVNQAVYGYAKVVYNLQTEANLLLTPITMVDDGTLNAILYSKGFVLKSCNDENYEVTTTWDTEFPIELSGTSIDPIYRRAYLIKRAMESRSRKAKAKLEFKLIG